MSIQKTITPIDNSVYLERPLSTQAEIDRVLKKVFNPGKILLLKTELRLLTNLLII
jgi:hypothetical protein